MSGPSKRTRAAVTAALFVALAGGRAFAQTPPAPVVTPSSGVLPGGVAYEIRPDPAQSGAAVALWYRAPSGGFGAVAVPGLSRLAAATVAASVPITGSSLSTLVERWGGRVGVSAFPDSVAVSALVPPDRVAQTVRAMTADFFAPVVTDAGLTAARRDATEDALFRSVGVESIEDALGAALFATGPLHDGTIPTAAGLGAVKVDRVRAFAERAFRPSNAILILTGNVDPAVLAGVATRETAPTTSSPSASGAEPPALQTPRGAGAAPQRRESGLAGTGLGWAGPPISAEADATALDFLADALFAAKSGAVARALGSLNASATGRFVTLRDPGVFLVTITGPDAAAARPIVDQAIADAAKPMTPATFTIARAGFVYRILSDMANPADLADVYGWYAIEGDPSYAPAEGGARGRYFTLVNQLTPATVAAAAAKYLGAPPAVVIVTKGAPAHGADHT